MTPDRERDGLRQADFMEQCARDVFDHEDDEPAPRGISALATVAISISILVTLAIICAAGLVGLVALRELQGS